MTDDTELERDRIAEGEAIAASELGRHELLHTASVVMDMFERHVLSHPAAKFGDEEIQAAADRAFDSLFEFYQLCGRKFL